MFFKFLRCFKIKQKTLLKFKYGTLAKINELNSFGKMKSWQIHSYGGLEELQFTNSRIPLIKDPNEVVVKVLASSVNPIDVAMISGYGSVVLNLMRQAKNCSLDRILEFPLTLGRDFSGVVIEKGHNVSEYSLNDEVWGVVPVQDQGAHAEQVIVHKNYIKKKPKNLTMVEAASMLYTATTAWSALKITGEMALFSPEGKTVLVLGASGGVGVMAIQMLNSWGVHVVATCSADAIPILKSFNLLDIIDYNATDCFEKIKNYRYDIIFDCAGIGQENAGQYVPFLKDFKFAKYITLKSPLLKNVDELGLVAGMAKNISSLLYVNFNAGVLPKTSSVRWGFFAPFETALSEITEDASNNRIKPVVQKIYKFTELPAAYEHVQLGHLRGKIVLDIDVR